MGTKNFKTDYELKLDPDRVHDDKSGSGDGYGGRYEIRGVVAVVADEEGAAARSVCRDSDRDTSHNHQYPGWNATQAAVCSGHERPWRRRRRSWWWWGGVCCCVSYLTAMAIIVMVGGGHGSPGMVDFLGDMAADMPSGCSRSAFSPILHLREGEETATAWPVAVGNEYQTRRVGGDNMHNGDVNKIKGANDDGGGKDEEEQRQDRKGTEEEEEEEEEREGGDGRGEQERSRWSRNLAMSDGGKGPGMEKDKDMDKLADGTAMQRRGRRSRRREINGENEGKRLMVEEEEDCPHGAPVNTENRQEGWARTRKAAGISRRSMRQTSGRWWRRRRREAMVAQEDHHGYDCGYDYGYDDRPTDRSLQAGSTGSYLLRPVPNSSLFRTSKLVVSYSSVKPLIDIGNEDVGYRSIVRHIVFGPRKCAEIDGGSQGDLDDGEDWNENDVNNERTPILYNVLEEVCELVNKQFAYRVLSVRKADLEANVTFPLTGEVITYWWPLAEPDGDKVSEPRVFHSKLQDEPMASINDMQISAKGSNLMLTTSLDPAYDPAVQSPATWHSTITYLSVLDGTRSSMVFAHLTAKAGTFAFTPSENLVYLAATSRDKASILRAKAAQSETPLNASTVFEMVETFSRNRSDDGQLHQGEDTNPTGDDPVVVEPSFAAGGFAANGSCLYFVDRSKDHLWAMGKSAGNTFSLIASGDEEKVSDGPLSRSGFVDLEKVAATADGCNLFVVDNYAGGRVRWVKLTSPCREGGVVETVAALDSGGSGLSSLALRDEGDRLRLYVGSFRGSIFEVEIDRSLLHACGHTPMNLGHEVDSSPPADGNYSSAYRDESDGSHSPRRTALELAVRTILPIIAVLCVILAGSLVCVNERRGDPAEDIDMRKALARSSLSLI
ncbi:hypothetical protein CBR_g508 [Chara braunii]|uniref:Uncharacterized protein n=1 Tax=Chara braunii TaxID=69332 RepID=A0A388KBD4_CHABU|nr:hypothetical protein CBR_g508 [Chara braunii]|eukprot:GBG67372.1 hypothetical protein CBR_g508 [Chara braunii]